MLSTLVLNRTFLNPCLGAERSDEAVSKEFEEEEIYYEEPDLSGGIEGVDYSIAYGAEDEGVDIENWERANIG